MKKGLRQLAGAALLILAIGVPSCAAFNHSVTDRAAAHHSAS